MDNLLKFLYRVTLEYTDPMSQQEYDKAFELACAKYASLPNSDIMISRWLAENPNQSRRTVTKIIASEHPLGYDAAERAVKQTIGNVSLQELVADWAVAVKSVEYVGEVLV